MIDILIFSKDRAMQCDLLIRSLEENFKCDFNLHIQYKHSSGKFKDGYEKLLREKGIIITCENSYHNFKEAFLLAVSCFKNKYCMFLCDDDVIINEVTQRELDCSIELLEDYFGLMSTVSFRLNEFVNYCYPAKLNLEIPEFIARGDLILWDWTKCDPFGCWGYPMSINTHIYERDKIIKLGENLQFNNVNSLEDRMNHNRDYKKNLMVSFRETKIFNIQDNFVKGGSNSRVEELNDLFLSGKHISTKNIYGTKQKQCHGVIEYVFE